MHEKKSQHATHRRAIVKWHCWKMEKEFLKCRQHPVEQSHLGSSLLQKGILWWLHCTDDIGTSSGAGGGFLPHFLFFLAFLQVSFFCLFWKVEILKCLEKRRQKKIRAWLKIWMGRWLFFSFQLLTYLHLAIAY